MVRGQCPEAVRLSFVLWLVAIAAGVFETGLVVATGGAGDDVVSGVAVRCLAFALAAWAAFRMRAGSRGARALLAVGLGVLGLSSLLLGPVTWLLDGHRLAEAMDGASASDWLFLASRCLHVSAVLAALVAMYRPSANAFFSRESAVSPRP